MTAAPRWLLAAFLVLAATAVRAQQATPGPVTAPPVVGTPSVSAEPAAPTPPKTVWSEVRVNGQFIAMTFDDGPSKVLTPKLLDILKERHMHVTFFVLGEMVKPHPEIIQRAIAEGHEIGNHSWDHPNLAKMSDEAVKSQLDRTKEVVMAATGGKPFTLMRPPYGSVTKEQKRWIHDDLGYTIILWDVDPDWTGSGPDPSIVEKRILRRHPQRVDHPLARHPSGHHRGDALHLRQPARQGVQVRHRLGVDRHEPAGPSETLRQREDGHRR